MRRARRATKPTKKNGGLSEAKMRMYGYPCKVEFVWGKRLQRRERTATFGDRVVTTTRRVYGVVRVLLERELFCSHHQVASVYVLKAGRRETNENCKN